MCQTKNYRSQRNDLAVSPKPFVSPHIREEIKKRSPPLLSIPPPPPCLIKTNDPTQKNTEYICSSTTLSLYATSSVSITSIKPKSAKMSRIFGRRSTSLKLMSPPDSLPLSEQENCDSLHDHHDSAYSSLLDPMMRATEPPEHRRTKSTPGAWMQGLATSGQDIPQRTWLSTAERRPSWTGERPPPRKLVKDPNGSGRPSFSVELSDSDGEKEKGVLRRQLTRLRSFYRREKPGP